MGRGNLATALKPLKRLKGEKPLVVNLNPVTALTRDEALVIYQRAVQQPMFFSSHILNVALWKKQRVIYDAVFNPEIQRVVCRACHASGKSYVAADIVLSYVHLMEPCAVITTAPTWRQISTILWKEIHRMYNRSRLTLGGNMLQTSYTLSDDAFALGLATDDPDKFQGIHAENILIIVDEGPGVDEEIFEAIEGIMAGGLAKLLVLGNPSSLEGSFYEMFNNPVVSKMYEKFTISAFDTPNVKMKRDVIPGLVTHKWVQERKELWGVEHPLYQIKVLGEFPSKEFGNLTIPPNLLDRAKNIERPPKPSDFRVLGVDVGELGGDETVIAYRHGDRLINVVGWIDAELGVSIDRIMRAVNEWNIDEVRIDKIGVGAGVYGRLRELALESNRFKVVGVDVREKCTMPDRYHDTRSEMWYEFREAMRVDKIDLTEFAKKRDADITFAQLTGPKYRPLPNTQLIKVERKEEMRGRGLTSPDRGDAVVQAFYDAYQAKEPTTNVGSPQQFEGILKDQVWTGWGDDLGDAPWRE